MKIKWHEVTWYSKALALGLFVLILLGGFYFGLEIGYLGGYAAGILKTVPHVAPIAPVSGATDSYYQNVAEWQTEQDAAGGFSIAYPIDFPTDSGAVTQTGGLGNLFFSLVIPKAFEPQTNFNDAKLTVGASRAGAVLTDCLAIDSLGGPAQATSTATINGTPFTVFHASDAGAGNLYDTTTYRMVHAGQCYAIEYTIHSSQIANYPAEYHLQSFDEAKLKDVLDRIVETFKFLN